MKKRPIGRQFTLPDHPRGVDDSRRMRENRCTAVALDALDALALLCKAMMQLEAGWAS